MDRSDLLKETAKLICSRPFDKLDNSFQRNIEKAVDDTVYNGSDGIFKQAQLCVQKYRSNLYAAVVG
jgi:hypothetical protein